MRAVKFWAHPEGFPKKEMIIKVDEFGRVSEDILENKDCMSFIAQDYAEEMYADRFQVDNVEYGWELIER